jgi:hypothetical protein
MGRLAQEKHWMMCCVELLYSVYGLYYNRAGKWLHSLGMIARVKC